MPHGCWIYIYLWQEVPITIRIITKLPNSEQSYKGKDKTHNYINRQNQSTTGKLWKPQWPWLGTIFGDVNVKNIFTSRIDKKKYPWHFWLLIFIHFHYMKMHRLYFFLQRRNIFRQDLGIGSEYKLFKRSNKANLFIALVQ